jgi:crotonobetainyl-CoA:carnitine CoA-transferase CaiB-like acyl-CoA transferase
MSAARLPLAGLRVLDYGQYVAAPFATMLLADLGADVIKVEPPSGDEWRRYDPFEPGESRYFYALNRGKRSVALDLKSAEGLERSRELIATADALVHNCLPERARRFGLHAEAVRAVNPRCVTVCVSAFGSAGPDSDRPAYDLIGQALSGLLLADPRPGDTVPHRTGGLALADFTAGLLAAVAVTAGLLDRDESAPELEVSLLGAALALQAQRFVAVDGRDAAAGQRDGAAGQREVAAGCGFAGRAELDAAAARAARIEALDPYYRAHACADGFVALACLNRLQRLAVCELLGLEDRFAANPQAEPNDEGERERRLAHVAAVEAGFARLSVREAVDALAARRVPASELRSLDQLFDDAQALANGLVQDVEQPGVGRVRLLGSPFKVDGEPTGRARPAPGLGAHAGELLGAPARP